MAQKNGTHSQFGLGRGQLSGNHRVRESHTIMAAVAERLVLGMAAAAELNGGSSGKPKGCAGRVADIEFALDLNWPVVETGDFRVRHPLDHNKRTGVESQVEH